MRLIGLLIALAIIGLLIVRQLEQPAVDDMAHPADTTTPQPPRVPQRAEDVPAFERELEQFTDDARELQQQRLDQATQ